MPNLFNQEVPPVAPQEPAPQGQPQGSVPTTPPQSTDLFADQLASIKNAEGQPKYGDVNAALTALQHSQDYIPQLQQEKDALAAEVATLKVQIAEATKLEDVVQRLTAQQEPPAATPAPGLDEAGVLDIMAKQRQADTRKENMAAVQTALVNQFGDKAQEVLQSKATELGTDLKSLAEMAQASPKLVLSLFGADHPSEGLNPFSFEFEHNQHG